MRAELKQFEEKMNKAINFYSNDINTIRAGRANPAILDKVQVEYYGVPSPLNQVGTVSVPASARQGESAQEKASLLTSQTRLPASGTVRK